MVNLAVPLTKPERERLQKIALQYGLSLAELSRRILTEIATIIPEERLEEYRAPKRLAASLKRAQKDYQAGRVRLYL